MKLRRRRGLSAGCGAALFGMLAWLAVVAPVSSAQVWKLKWSDEFNGPAGAPPDPESWTFDTGGGGWGNKELETYCAPYSKAAPCDPSQPNLYQDGNGNLVIRAVNTNGTWTSGRMKTSGKEAVQYGRVEARMKLAAADGFWPAFWMLGDNMKTAGWPKAGEQDIMEWVQSYGPTTTSSTIHGPGYSGAHGIGGRFTFPNGGRIDDAGYHTYGVVWSKDRLQFYRDDPAQPYLTITPAKLPPGTEWVYNHPFFLLLNFAIGSGGFAGTTDATTPKAGTVLVDYVRVYQASETIDQTRWYSVRPEGGEVSCAFGCGLGSVPSWQFTATTDGYYRVKTRTATAAVVAHGEGRRSNAKLMKVGEADASSVEEWMPERETDGSYLFVNRATRRCLSASASGSSMPQEELCRSGAAQRFVLTEQP